MSFNHVTEADLKYFRELLPGRVFSGEDISTDYDHDEMTEYGHYMPEAVLQALSAEEKMARGRVAIAALAEYRTAKDPAARAAALAALRENFAYFGYGYLKEPGELVKAPRLKNLQKLNMMITF